LFQGVMKKLEIMHISKGGFGFVRSLIRVPQPWDEWMNEWMDGWIPPSSIF